MSQHCWNTNHSSHTRKHLKIGKDAVRDHAERLGATRDGTKEDNPTIKRGDKTPDDMGDREKEVIPQYITNKNQRVPQGRVTQIL